MSLISELREIIEELLESEKTVSGVEIMGRFDYQWHAIPTLNEFRRAVEKIIDLEIAKDEQGVLQFSTGANSCAPDYEIVEEDIIVLCELYLKRIKKK